MAQRPQPRSFNANLAPQSHGRESDAPRWMMHFKVREARHRSFFCIKRHREKGNGNLRLETQLKWAYVTNMG
jgi:hypothetical protein